MSGQDFPRVLFLTSAAFNRTTGGGITFGNLFAGWPKDRLATAHNDPVPVTTETCEQYYRLGSAEIRRWGPLERIAPAAGREVRDPDSSNASRGSGSPLLAAKTLLFGPQLPDTGCLSAALEAWIAQFRPEVLYTILGNNANMELAGTIRRRFNVPLVLHMMDDWPATSYRGGALGFLARDRMETLLARLMGEAGEALAICDAMAEAYTARYGRPFTAVQNAIDLARWPAGAQAGGPAHAPARFVYAGSVLPFAQLESLVQCCEAVAKLGEAARLTLYCPAMYTAPHRARLLAGANIELRDALTDDAQFHRAIASADALLLPVNFDAHSVDYIRYSMPTKVPAYLASGTPVLAYGPSEVAQIRYAKDADWALVVEHQEPEALVQGMRRLISDWALRRRLSENARRAARERHDAAEVRGRFQGLLSQAAAAGKNRPLR